MASIPKMTTINHAIHSDVEEVDPVLALVLFETNLLVVFAVFPPLKMFQNRKFNAQHNGKAKD